MEKLKKVFRTYFRYLNEHVIRWNSLMLSSEKHLTVVSNLSDQLQVVLRAELHNQMIQLFPDIKQRLSAKLFSMLEDEISQLQKIQESLNNYNRDLRIRLIQLEQAYKQFPSVEEQTDKITSSPLKSETPEKKVDILQQNIKNDDNFDPFWPQFGELFDMAGDSWRFYHDTWLNINVTLVLVDYEDSNTIKLLRDSFKKDYYKKQHLSNEKLPGLTGNHTWYPSIEVALASEVYSEMLLDKS